MTKVKLKIKAGDQIVVLVGADRGKEGEVVKVFPKKNRAIVQGVNMIKKHTKPSAQNPQGGIIETEATIHISNLALLDPETGKASKVGYKFEDGKKVRISKKSGKTI